MRVQCVVAKSPFRNAILEKGGGWGSPEGLERVGCPRCARVRSRKTDLGLWMRWLPRLAYSLSSPLGRASASEGSFCLRVLLLPPRAPPASEGSSCLLANGMQVCSAPSSDRGGGASTPPTSLVWGTSCPGPPTGVFRRAPESPREPRRAPGSEH
eukprot:9225084-Alexandrium_andersonii.AAC.2